MALAAATSGRNSQRHNRLTRCDDGPRPAAQRHSSTRGGAPPSAASKLRRHTSPWPPKPLLEAADQGRHTTRPAPPEGGGVCNNDHPVRLLTARISPVWQPTADVCMPVLSARINQAMVSVNKSTDFSFVPTKRMTMESLISSSVFHFSPPAHQSYAKAPAFFCQTPSIITVYSNALVLFRFCVTVF